MRPTAYIFDAPAQRLRAADRVISCSEPAIVGATVLYVKSARSATAPPTPYAPVSVITTPLGRSDPELEEPARVAWGTRVKVERIPEPGEEYHVSALERVTFENRLEVQTLSALSIRRADYPDAFGEGDAPAVGAVVSELLGETSGFSILDAAERGEMIEAWWYLDNHRIETPSEASAREAADLFADHTVRLRRAGGDAGETCQSCGAVISWLDHLPPSRSGELARCRRARVRA